MFKSHISLIFALITLSTFAVAEPAPRIINGTNASEGEYPWMASLYVTGSSPDVYGAGHFCGGALIDPSYILTAAHCVEDFVSQPEALSIAIGRTLLSSSAGVVRQAAGISIHPDYDPYMLSGDIALIKLSEPVAITPLSLIAPGEESLWDEASPATAVGWGYIDPRADVMPDNLQEAVIPMHSDANCRTNLGIAFDPESMVCAGILSSAAHLNDGTSVCNGDSGSPLLVSDGVNWKAVGVTSWGFSCAGNRYAAWSRVIAYRTWLLSFPDISPAIKDYPLITSNVPTDTSSTTSVGATLTCGGASFAGDNLTYTFRWKDYSNKVLKEESILTLSSTYLVPQSELNEYIYCEVEATNNSGSAYSPSLNAVYVTPAAAPIDTTPPLIESVKINCNNRKNCKVISTASDDSGTVNKIEASYFYTGSTCKKNKCREVERSGLFNLTLTGANWTTDLEIPGAGKLVLVQRASDKTGNVSAVKRTSKRIRLKK